MTTEGNSERNSIMKYQEKTSSSSNVLLSVDEILGLVVGDEDDHDDQESDSESPPPPVRSDSLGAVESSHSLSFAFPPPPAQRRAQTWHAMTGRNDTKANLRSKQRQKSNRNRDYLGANTTDEDESDNEISYLPNHPRLSLEASQYPPRSNNNTLYPLHPTLVESQIAPFETTRKQERTGVGTSNSLPSHHHLIDPPSATLTAKKKKPTSRFEIFEDKLREEQGTFGIML